MLTPAKGQQTDQSDHIDPTAGCRPVSALPHFECPTQSDLSTKAATACNTQTSVIVTGLEQRPNPLSESPKPSYG